MNTKNQKTPILSVQNLSFAYDKALFRELSFDLFSGELIHIKGENGCGKTTLLKCLLNFVRPNSGNIHWLSALSNDSNALPVAQYLAFENGIKQRLTAKENLLWVIQSFANPQQQSPKQQQQAYCQQILEQIGLAHVANTFASQLSAGQQRRLAIGRLLIQSYERSVWLLDEPYVALDQASCAWFDSVMSDHCQRGGSVMLTSHQVLSPSLLKHLSATIEWSSVEQGNAFFERIHSKKRTHLSDSSETRDD